MLLLHLRAAATLVRAHSIAFPADRSDPNGRFFCPSFSPTSEASEVGRAARSTTIQMRVEFLSRMELDLSVEHLQMPLKTLS